jgi:FtsP/CotA-like multicopper oxidase with cupredoxin domain
MNAINKGEAMKIIRNGLIVGAFSMLFVALPASAQDSNIRVQCPRTTTLHPVDLDNPPLGNFPSTPVADINDPPGDNFPGVEDTDWNGDGLENASENEDVDHNGDTNFDVLNADAIKCDHLAAGDGMVTMADTYTQYIFSFHRLPLPGGPVDPEATVDCSVEPDRSDSTICAPDEASGQYPGWVMAQGMLAANAPAPTIEVDEDDELFLSLTNVGMTMRPDLFDPHTIHWHGFPQASSIFDGVPDSSISINMGATLTYYYSAKDAGTYMYHCHVEATEHMQMGMLGNLLVHPRQNKLADGDDLFVEFGNNGANVSKGGTTPAPAATLGVTHTTGTTYAYNDGDGTTAYDVDYPIQMGSFDPDFHDASLNVQPLPFAGMDDRYFMLNGRGYPDTVNPAVLSTVDPLDVSHDSQPINSLITAAPGQRILLRISNLNITAFYTLGTNGLPMEVIGLDARLLGDDAGKNMYYKTNSLTLGGGQSADVIITAPLTTGTFFLYTQNLDHLSNNTENFGGMMTEIKIQ